MCARSETVTSWGGNLVGTLRDKEFHEPPDRNCGCGIYALDDLRELYNQYRYCVVVVAVISASGRTVECAKGFKTQSARVVAYWVLEHLQGCPCELCRKRDMLPIQGAWFKGECFGSGRGDTFPYVECCENQFINAGRWTEPDTMAVHYGLKATPLPVRVKLATSDLSPIIDSIVKHPPGAQGHYEFEIPI